MHYGTGICVSMDRVSHKCLKYVKPQQHYYTKQHHSRERGLGYLNIESWTLSCWLRGRWTSEDKAGLSSMWSLAEMSGFRSEQQAKGSDPKSLQHSKPLKPLGVFLFLRAPAFLFRAMIQRWQTSFDLIRMCVARILQGPRWVTNCGGRQTICCSQNVFYCSWGIQDMSLTASLCC